MRETASLDKSHAGFEVINDSHVLSCVQPAFSHAALLVVALAPCRAYELVFEALNQDFSQGGVKPARPPDGTEIQGWSRRADPVQI